MVGGAEVELSGRCACGSAQYVVGNKPLFTQICHCTDCQRTPGSAFVVHLIIPRSDFSITGDTSVATLPTGSGSGCDIHFCRECGTYLWCKYRYHTAPVMAIRCGTLDDPSTVVPQAHIFTRSMQPWIRLPEGVPSFSEGCDRNEVWPQDSLDKYNALVGTG